jgi:hypothetical protein
VAEPNLSVQTVKNWSKATLHETSQIYMCHRESLRSMWTLDEYHGDLACLLILENRQPSVAAPQTPLSVVT